MKRKLFPIAGILFLSLLPGTLAAQYQSPDLKSGKKSIKNVLILPPETTLVKSGMKGSEPLVAESQAWGSGLSSVVAHKLSAKGFHVLEDPFTTAALDQNPDLKYALADLQARYDKLQVLLQKKPKDVRKGRFTLGDEVANFSPGAAADVLVFARAKGVLPTTGLKTFVVLTGMGITYSHASVDISIVDAQTGTVLYFAKPGINGNFVGNPETMGPAIEHSFLELNGQQTRGE